MALEKPGKLRKFFFSYFVVALSWLDADFSCLKITSSVAECYVEDDVLMRCNTYNMHCNKCSKSFT